MKKEKLIGMIISVAIIGTLFLACSDSKETPEKVGYNPSASTTAPKAQTQIFNIGEQIRLGQNIVVINSITETTSDNEFMQPEQGKKFVSFDVTMENDGQEATNYNLFDYKLQDGNDYSYDPDLAQVKEPSFGSGALQPGQKTRGWVTFQVPAEQIDFKVIFQPNWLSTNQVIIKAPLL